MPVGTFLSGGIDSSTVTAMMAGSTGAPFPTFSIGVKEQGFNELPWARMVAQKYGLAGRERIVEADMIHLIPAMVAAMDEPSDPFGAGVYLVSQLAAEEVKVVLSGDGGDENFAGYDRFAGQRLAEIYSVLPAWLRRQVHGAGDQAGAGELRLQEPRAEARLAQRHVVLLSAASATRAA